ncbi:helix-turn-helix domain-containing protein [Paenibacillus abyssi]|uniref:Transcriptional regulator n=1 Tax=Paenibacillus abyssi TaxID=1340531 RepID=A0A917CGR8_9BACL|nr:helix-turn-helix transcriptional regulator [Paenibacillus abyssi]GGF87997.1 transcriptional regulator [Paenibacillus abyssi]
MSLIPSYRPFRVRMAERNLDRQDLEENTGLNRNTIGRLYNDKSVSIDTLAVVCHFLDCRIEDVVEFVEDSAGNR